MKAPAALISTLLIINCIAQQSQYQTLSNLGDDKQKAFRQFSSGNENIPLVLLYSLTVPWGESGKHMSLLEIMPEYGFIVESGNEGEVPLGFSVYSGRTVSFAGSQMGISCAACHTGSFEYDGQKYLIDGMPSMVDFEGWVLKVVGEIEALMPGGKSREQSIINVVYRIIKYNDLAYAGRSLIKKDDFLNARSILNPTRSEALDIERYLSNTGDTKLDAPALPDSLTSADIQESLRIIEIMQGYSHQYKQELEEAPPLFNDLGLSEIHTRLSAMRAEQFRERDLIAEEVNQEFPLIWAKEASEVLEGSRVMDSASLNKSAKDLELLMKSFKREGEEVAPIRSGGLDKTDSMEGFYITPASYLMRLEEYQDDGSLDKGSNQRGTLTEDSSLRRRPSSLPELFTSQAEIIEVSNWYFKRDHRSIGASVFSEVREAGAMLLASYKALSKLKGSPQAGFGRDDAFSLVDLILIGKGEYSFKSPVSIPDLFGVNSEHWFHYDGNTSSSKERNVAQFLALGVLPSKFRNQNERMSGKLEYINNLIDDIETVPWPAEILGEVDEEAKERGMTIFYDEKYSKYTAYTTEGKPATPLGQSSAPMSCASCHTTPRLPEAQLFYNVETSSNRRDHYFKNKPALDRLNAKLRTVMQDIYSSPSDGEAEPWLARQGYRARSLIGIWASPPYLHNGSVSSLMQLLTPPDERLDFFWVGNLEYDPINVGYESKKPSHQRGSLYENYSEIGNSKLGHSFGTELLDEQKKDLIEFLKFFTVNDLRTNEEEH